MDSPSSKRRGSSASTSIVKQGWAYQKKGRWMPWKLKWLVLRHDIEGVLEVFQERGDASDWRLAEDSINLTSCTIEVKAKEKKPSFCLKSLSKTLVFSVQTIMDMEEWVMQLANFSRMKSLLYVGDCETVEDSDVISQESECERSETDTASTLMTSATPAIEKAANEGKGEFAINARYQKLKFRETHSADDYMKESIKLCQVVGHFEKLVMKYGRQLIDAIHDKKTSPDISRGDTFIIQGIRFRFSMNPLEENQEVIQERYKQSSLQWNAIQAFNAVRCDFCTSLMTALDYKGFRLEAYAMFHRYDESNPFSASCNLEDIEKLMISCNKLSLKKDITLNVEGESILVNFPSTIKMQCVGKDVYITCLADILPRDPIVNTASGTSTMRFRHEFIRSPNLQFSSKQSLGDDINEAPKRILLETVLPQFVRKLDDLQIIPIDGYSFSKELHHHGINIRYLGKLSSLTKLPHVKDLCYVEMVSRACKVIFRERLRKAVLHFRNVEATKIDNEMDSYIISLFHTTLASKSSAKKFWEEHICKKIEKKFGINIPFTHFITLNRQHLFQSLQYQCGVVFKSDVVIKNFDLEELRKAFILRVPQIKHANLPLPHNGSYNLSTEDMAVFELACHAGQYGNQVNYPSNPSYVKNWTAYKLLKLARIYIGLGRLEEAHSYCTSALSISETYSIIRALILIDLLELELVHPKETKVDNNQEESCKERVEENDFANLKEVSLSYFEEAVQIVSFCWGDAHPLLLKFYERMACLFGSRGDYDIAKQYQEKALAISLRALGKNHNLSAQQLFKLGTFFYFLGYNEEAVEKLSEAQHVFHDLNKQSSEADCHFYLAEALFGNGNITPAIEHSKTALAIRESGKQPHLQSELMNSYRQVARLVLANYMDPDYSGPVTAIVKEAFETGIWCFERIFKQLKLKWEENPKTGNRNTCKTSVLSLETPWSTLSASPFTHQPGSPDTRNRYKKKELQEEMMSLIRSVVDLKLKLISSNLKESIRLTRVQYARKGYSSQDIKEVIVKLIHLTPSVFLEGIFQRLQQGEKAASIELGIVLQLVESCNINVVST